MDELINPAHGISWSAIIFVAGGCYFLIRSLQKSVEAHAKVLSELVVKLTGSSTELVRCMKDVDDMRVDIEDIREDVTQHMAWATEKMKSVDGNHVGVVERVSRIEGKIFNGKRD